MTKPAAHAPAYLESVRDQYEDFPYPPRDPEREQHLQLIPLMDNPDLLNFYCFNGKLKLDKNFRVLVAGGGTGDCTIYFAELLKNTGAQVVHVDISGNSIDIAKRRAQKRGLKNIEWVQRSLLELPELGLGEFDYINCGGVLHHLADPDAGLKALSGVLKDDGAMGIMVYGKHGRTGVYYLQQALRLLTKNIKTGQEKVELAKAVLANLPPGNWYHHLKRHFAPGIANFGDAEIYDLFLHSQDRPYSVPEIYDWVERCGLNFLNFVFYDGLARVVYNPATFLADASLAQRAAGLDIRKQQALAELLYGEILMHFFYVSKQPKQYPHPQDETCIPYFTSISGFPDTRQAVLQQIKAAGAQPVAAITNARKSGQVALARGPNTEALLQLLDGKRSIGDIYKALEGRGANAQQLRADFYNLFGAMQVLDWMLLKRS